MEKLIIAGREFNSRLFLGTGKFSSNEWMEQSILASGTEMVTVAMKRVDMESTEDDMLKHIVHPHIQLLPNTSGVRNAEEAVFAAQMAREAFGTNWLKLEIHPDPRYLLPDSVETLKATEELVKLGFVVLPYCQADPVLCKQLEEAGAATVMPLGAPIGTNKGLQTKEFLQIIIEQAGIPVVVDAGSGGYGNGCIGMPGKHSYRRSRQPDRNGKSLQAGSRSRTDGIRGRTGYAGHRVRGGSKLTTDGIFKRIKQ